MWNVKNPRGFKWSHFAEKVAHERGGGESSRAKVENG